jgi:hypothetical protein
MRHVVGEVRRVLRPRGSAVFILQPNSARAGRLRLWPWEFLLWAGRQWNVVQDLYWFARDTGPIGGACECGLLRPSTRLLVWCGPPGCYRAQDRVLTEASGRDVGRRDPPGRRPGPCGFRNRPGRMARVARDRGGSTPHNCLPLAAASKVRTGHPAETPWDVAHWLCRYLLPPGGVLLDPFAGGGTVLAAGLDCGASRVIGLERRAAYVRLAGRTLG